MAKQELPVDFKDDVLQAEMAGKRKYRIIQNEDGTISLEDVTNYSQIGSNFGAAQMNATNLAVNESFDKNKVIDSLVDIVANEATGYAAGALAVRELNGKSIIESGKNDNGYYRKYADGTLEMWGTSNAIGSQGVVIVTLPQPFIDTVFRMCANQIYHSNTPVSVTSTQVQSKQSFLIYAREPNGTLPASGCKYNWFVTGTWK